MFHPRPINLISGVVLIGALALTAAAYRDLVSAPKTPDAPASAAVDMYLKIEGVEGEATAKGHEGWIELQTFSWGVSAPASGAGAAARRAATRAEFQDISIVKQLDKASPHLALACAEGKHFPQATLVWYRAGSTGTPMGSLRITNVLITSTVAGTDADSPRPVENVSLNYGAIEWSYYEADAAGRARGVIKTGWDLQANKKL